MKIGVYVGSFNPVHKGHIRIVNHLIEKQYVDKIIIIPTGNYWDKNNLIKLEDRIKMLKYYENNKVEVNSNLNSLPYTYLILEELSKLYKTDNLYLIIGADNLNGFHLWENLESIYKHKILVIPRGEIKFSNKLDKNKFIVVSDFDSLDFSSTKVREKLIDNKTEGLDKYIDKCILNYILTNKIAFK